MVNDSVYKDLDKYLKGSDQYYAKAGQCIHEIMRGTRFISLGNDQLIEKST